MTQPLTTGELVERLLAMNPWKDMDWPEVAKAAATHMLELEQERNSLLVEEGTTSADEFIEMALELQEAKARVTTLERELEEAQAEVARYWTSADLTPWVELAESKGLGHFGKKLKGMFNRAMNAEASARASQAEVERLKAALNDLLERHVALVGSGDCGNWDVEKEEAVIAARAALQVEERKT